MRPGQIFRFDEIRVDVADQSVVRGDATLKMPPRVFQTLLILLEASPRMVSKTELCETLWPDTIVDESGLAQNIHLLRKILGPGPDGAEYIQTVPKRGYRLAAQVHRESIATAAALQPRKSPWLRPAALSAGVLLLASLTWVALRPSFARKSPHAEAVRLTMMAQEVWKNTLNASPAAEQQFRQAIQIDPGYAPAYVGLATFEATRADHVAEAERLIHEALRIDSGSSQAHATAAFIAMIHRWDWNLARSEFERALALDPRNTAARRWYSMYFSFRGEYAAAIQQIRAALEIEPGSASLLMQQCSELSYEEKFDAALQSCDAALQAQPRLSRAHARMFQIYGVIGNAELAGRHLILAADPEEDLGTVKVLAAHIEAAAQERGLAGVLEDHFHAPEPYNRAEAFAMLHDRAGALANLRQAIDSRGFFSAFIRAEATFHFLYGDPEFEDLLRRVGLPPTQRDRAMR